MTLKEVFIVTGLALSSNSIAGTMGPIESKQAGAYLGAPLPWVVIGSLGYTRYQNISDCIADGQTAIGRFAIGRELLNTRYSNFGLELGLQSGNTMRLDVSEAILDELGGMPIQTTMKPMLDILATVKIAPIDSLLFAQIKGGGVYRYWQFDGRNSVKDISKINGEIQAGFGYSIGRLTAISLLYQGIYGSDPNFTLSATCPSGRVSALPTQQGVLLSFSFNAL